MTKQEFYAHLSLLGFVDEGEECYIRYPRDLGADLERKETPFNVMVLYVASEGVFVYLDYDKPVAETWSKEYDPMLFADAWQIIFEFCKEHPGD